MSRNELQRALDALQIEIDRLHSSDQDMKDRLAFLISDVEQTLEQAEDKPDTAGLDETIGGLIEQFEVEHPKITETLNRIMISLASMGI